MVNVLTPPTGKSATCRECNAVLSYLPNEVKEDYSTDYTGGRDYYKFITCPCCSSKVIVR